MDFELTHTFNGDHDQIVKTSLDERLLPILQQRMETVLEVESLDIEESGATLKRRVRYLPRPLIKSIGIKKISPKSMEWVEESEFDLDRCQGDFHNIPTHSKMRSMLTNEGRITFEDLGGGQTRRTIAGRLNIKVGLLLRPLVPIALRVIHKNAAKILDEQAMVLQQVLDEGGLD